MLWVKELLAQLVQIRHRHYPQLHILEVAVDLVDKLDALIFNVQHQLV
jgi:hypothetical protein